MCCAYEERVYTLGEGVIYKYFDFVAATIEVLKDYNNIKAIHKLSTSATMASSNIVGIDVNAHRMQHAAEYLNWVEPALKELSETESLVLSEFYMKYGQRSGAPRRLEQILNYSDRQIERMRSVAIARLSKLLSGV